jgi:hypothetical protein
MKAALYAPPPATSVALAFALLAPLALLGACASTSPPSASAQQQATAEAAGATSPDSGWLALRAKYMDCVQHQADAGMSGNGQTKAVVAAALDACAGELQTMHDAFRDYLSAEMVSSHGKAGARHAADRVTKDTREKARVYLMGYVDHERYLAKSR